MARKTRGDCTLGTFEKNTLFLLEQLEIQMTKIQEVTKKSEQYVKNQQKENKNYLG